MKSFPDHDEDHQPFPTLERALSVIDTHAGKQICHEIDFQTSISERPLIQYQSFSIYHFFTSGFNIEIKWDMENMDGTRESHNAFEMNVFVDAILLTVLRNAKSRKIVFSTFNPDICTV